MNQENMSRLHYKDMGEEGGGERNFTVYSKNNTI
jgi:hypothetical protein